MFSPPLTHVQCMTLRNAPRVTVSYVRNINKSVVTFLWPKSLDRESLRADTSLGKVHNSTGWTSYIPELRRMSLFESFGGSINTLGQSNRVLVRVRVPWTVVMMVIAESRREPLRPET